MKTLVRVSILVCSILLLEGCSNTKEIREKNVTDSQDVKVQLEYGLASHDVQIKCTSIKSAGALRSLKNEVEMRSEFDGLIEQYIEDCDAVGNIMNKDEANDRIAHLLNTIKIETTSL